MALVSMKAQKREDRGTRRTRRIRKAGRIPGIVYGHGIEPLAVSMDKRELEIAVHKGERLLALDLGGSTENVLVKDVQYDAFQQEIIHIDLARVNLDERVKVTVPIILRGTPAGASDGGVITQVIADVEIETLVTSIPDDIRASVAEMKVNDVMHMKDLPMPEGARLLSAPEAIVATCAVVAEEVAAPAEGEAVAAGGAEPEVIGAKKEEEAAEGADKKESKK